MSKFYEYLKVNKFFLIITFIYLFISSIYVLSTPKGAFLLWLNYNHNEFLDYFFYYFTYLGDGLFVLFIIIILALFKYKDAICLFVIYSSSGIVAQLLKVIFSTPRPKAYFEGIVKLHFVHWIDIYSTYSMPSGHTASAFALAYFISTLTKNIFIKILLLVFAILVAISRVYLCQHFPEDTIVGAFLGILITNLCDFYFSEKINSPKLQKGLISNYFN